MAPPHAHRCLSRAVLGVVVGLLALTGWVGTAVGADSSSGQGKAYLHEGLQAFRKGRLPEAAQAFERATTVEPTNPIAFNNLGLVYMQLGRKRDAITAFEEAVDLRPTSAVFHYNLARACHLAKNYPRAIEHYQKTVALKPAHALAHAYLGQLYGREQQRYPEAIEEFKKAIDLDASNGETHYSLAVAYFSVKNFSEAWRSVKEAERLGYKVNPAFLKALRQMAPEPQ
ncbi:MAG: tetratricopeptide repeat protein [Candidatus Tectimicrobiota bacterium]